MALWMGAVRLPDRDFRFRDANSDAWVAFKRVEGGWRVAANAFNSKGSPVLRSVREARDGQPFSVIEEDAFLILLPLPPGTTMNPKAPPTAEGDLLLILRAFNREGVLVFDVRQDMIGSKGLFIDVFGPQNPMPENVLEVLKRSESSRRETSP